MGLVHLRGSDKNPRRLQRKVLCQTVTARRSAQAYRRAPAFMQKTAITAKYHAINQY
jgi:hypothetical protein